MLTSSPPNRTGTLSGLLWDGLRALDITDDERAVVVSRYESLGATFDDHWSITTRGDNVIRPQGSFLLGTVVRNIHRDDDIDIDAVALRDIDKASLSQLELKTDAGVAVQRHAQSSRSGQPMVSECHRCWTLQWPGMHLDLLPAVPNREPTESGIWITDRDVRRWLRSDPSGYAAWFHSRIEEQAASERFRIAMSKRLEIEEVPDWQVKTSLQRAVQALKRHRDVFFAGHLDDRPASVIITTLAARAYEGGDDLYEVLRHVTGRMGAFVRRVDGQWLVANPVLVEENFADGWADHPERAAWFFKWVERAAADFNGFGRKTGLDHIIPLFKDAFGERFANATTLGLGNSLFTARTTGSLSVGSGGVLATTKVASTIRSVKGHGFAGGTRG